MVETKCLDDEDDVWCVDVADREDSEEVAENENTEKKEQQRRRQTSVAWQKTQLRCK